MLRLRLAVLVAICVILSMAGFGCGADRSERDAASRPAAAAQTNIVSNADIRRTRPGTPERSILTWAQAVQFRDLAAVRAAYTERVRRAVTIQRMYAATRTVGSLLGRPEIVNSKVRGTLARVRVALISFGASGERTQQPITFSLRREDGQWLLEDAGLLLDSAAALRRLSG